MIGTVIVYPKFRAEDNDGEPLIGGLLYPYEAGTSTPLPTFSDSALSVPNTHPVVLDGRGEAIVFLSPSPAYKFILQDANAVEIWSMDNIAAYAPASDVAALQDTVDDLAAAAIDNSLCQGRLSLTSGAPVTSGDVTAATSIFFNPYRGNRVALYDGSAAWALYPFQVLTLNLGTDAANTNYDVFIGVTAGVVVLSRFAWASATARSIALTLQDGVLVGSGDTTRRYLGTYRTSATGQCEDSETKRFVWNYNNRVRRSLRKVEATATWTYSTATFRQANAGAANQVETVVGYLESLLELEVRARIANSSANVAVAVSIGESSTTTPATGVQGQAGLVQVAAQAVDVGARLTKLPALGYAYWAWLEKSAATGTSTWQGTTGDQVAGLIGSLDA